MLSFRNSVNLGRSRNERNDSFERRPLTSRVDRSSLNLGIREKRQKHSMDIDELVKKIKDPNLYNPTEGATVKPERSYIKIRNQSDHLTSDFENQEDGK